LCSSFLPWYAAGINAATFKRAQAPLLLVLTQELFAEPGSPFVSSVTSVPAGADMAAGAGSDTAAAAAAAPGGSGGSTGARRRLLAGAADQAQQPAAPGQAAPNATVRWLQVVVVVGATDPIPFFWQTRRALK
jgi:hypothetical protein